MKYPKQGHHCVSFPPRLGVPWKKEGRGRRGQGGGAGGFATPWTGPPANLLGAARCMPTASFLLAPVTRLSLPALPDVPSWPSRDVLGSEAPRRPPPAGPPRPPDTKSFSPDVPTDLQGIPPHNPLIQSRDSTAGRARHQDPPAVCTVGPSAVDGQSRPPLLPRLKQMDASE